MDSILFLWQFFLFVIFVNYNLTSAAAGEVKSEIFSEFFPEAKNFFIVKVFTKLVCNLIRAEL